MERCHQGRSPELRMGKLGVRGDNISTCTYMELSRSTFQSSNMIGPFDHINPINT